MYTLYLLLYCSCICSTQSWNLRNVQIGTQCADCAILIYTCIGILLCTATELISFWKDGNRLKGVVDIDDVLQQRILKGNYKSRYLGGKVK